MVDTIIELFTGLPNKLTAPLQQLVNTIRVWGNNAADWWEYALTRMRYDIDAYIYSIQRAIAAIQSFHATVGGSSGGGTTGFFPEERGIVRRVTNAILHPGEIILNLAQQRNVVQSLAMAMPSGAGASALNINMDQRNWVFEGSPNLAQVKRLVQEGTNEGITEVMNQALDERSKF